MASLPPISIEIYQTIFAPSTKPDIPSDNKAPTASESETESAPAISEEDLPTPQQCIFCLAVSESTLQNIEHMSTCHGLVLPDLQNLQTDVDTLISYLGLVTAHYCECLFCGATKRSAHATRMHMLAKGHCMLDLSAGSEFLEFWESESDGSQDTNFPQRNYQLVSETEMRLASGAIATSRSNVDSGIQHLRSRLSKEERRPREELPTPPRSERPVSDVSLCPSSRQARRQNPLPSRALAVRDQMGLIGLSDVQRRALAVSQRKIDLSALRSRNKAQWTLEKMGNKVKQKHFVVGSPCRSGWFLDPVMR